LDIFMICLSNFANSNYLGCNGIMNCLF
jgi:hypothetical protein